MRMHAGLSKDGLRSVAGSRFAGSRFARSHSNEQWSKSPPMGENVGLCHPVASRRSERTREPREPANPRPGHDHNHAHARSTPVPTSRRSRSSSRPKARECEECVKIRSTWVHLRTCQTCGVTLCCDSSPNRHASKHAQRQPAPGRRLGRARRALAVLLSRTMRSRSTELAIRGLAWLADPVSQQVGQLGEDVANQTLSVSLPLRLSRTGSDGSANRELANCGLTSSAPRSRSCTACASRARGACWLPCRPRRRISRCGVPLQRLAGAERDHDQVPDDRRLVAGFDRADRILAVRTAAKKFAM